MRNIWVRILTISVAAFAMLFALTGCSSGSNSGGSTGSGSTGSGY